MGNKRAPDRPQTRAAPRDEAAPPPPAARRVRVALLTIDDVRAEMARLYREARGRRLETAEASKLANILAIMGRLIEGADIERRVAAIEAAQQAASL